MADAKPEPTIVLVHGAWESPEHWNDVVDELGDLADATAIADLPSMQRPDATFDDDVAHVRDIAGDGPVVLCGHSYGGAVISAAAVGLRDVRHLVYVAAFAPEPGETVFTLASERPMPDLPQAELREDGTIALTGWANPNHHEPRTIASLEAFPPRTYPTGVAVTPIPDVAWREVPSTYLLATRDEIVHPDTQREMAQRAGSRILEIETHHFVQLSHPEDVAGVLRDTVAATPWRHRLPGARVSPP